MKRVRFAQEKNAAGTTNESGGALRESRCNRGDREGLTRIYASILTGTKQIPSFILRINPY